MESGGDDYGSRNISKIAYSSREDKQTSKGPRQYHSK